MKHSIRKGFRVPVVRFAQLSPRTL